MKLNLDKQLIGIRGEPMQNKLNEALADVFALSTAGNPGKMITWAVNLVNDGEIEVSENELKFIANVVENSPNVINLAKARLLEEINKVKEGKQNE